MKKFLIIAILSTSLFSCAKEKVEPKPIEGEIIGVKVVLENNDGTLVSSKIEF